MSSRDGSPVEVWIFVESTWPAASIVTSIAATPWVPFARASDGIGGGVGVWSTWGGMIRPAHGVGARAGVDVAGIGVGRVLDAGCGVAATGFEALRPFLEVARGIVVGRFGCFVALMFGVGFGVGGGVGGGVA